jgi:NADPH-dependent ferric siderophore reductase
MLEIYFLVRHTPFWAVPFIIIGGEFAYLFWLKKKKRSAFICLFLAFLGLSAISFYYWAGGPEKSVKIIRTTLRDNL